MKSSHLLLLVAFVFALGMSIPLISLFGYSVRYLSNNRLFGNMGVVIIYVGSAIGVIRHYGVSSTKFLISEPLQNQCEKTVCLAAVK